MLEETSSKEYRMLTDALPLTMCHILPVEKPLEFHNLINIQQTSSGKMIATAIHSNTNFYQWDTAV